MSLSRIWSPKGRSQSQEHNLKLVGCPKIIYLGELVHIQVFSDIHEDLPSGGSSLGVNREEETLPDAEVLSLPSHMPAPGGRRILSSHSALQSQISIKTQRWEGRVSAGHHVVICWLAPDLRWGETLWFLPLGSFWCPWMVAVEERSKWENT